MQVIALIRYVYIAQELLSIHTLDRLDSDCPGFAAGVRTHATAACSVLAMGIKS